MPQHIQIILSPRDAAVPELLNKSIAYKIGCHPQDIIHLNIIRRSIDARRRSQVKIVIQAEVFLSGEPLPGPKYQFRFQQVSSGPEIIIVGAGPAGLFAAFKLLELGFKPVIIERGKDVSERKKDIATLCRGEGLNTESNYCFGEGGAGTFSDGKLYTRSRKKGDTDRVLELFHLHGANDDILYDAHPHIGTDILPVLIKNMRETIKDHGGEFHFGKRLSDLIIRQDRVSGIVTSDGDKFEGKAVMLATGHSAHDVYDLFHRNGYLLESKPFAVGIRIEHPQVLINELSYHRSPEIKYLPAAAYSLTAQVNNRGVYSFCMCPGGYIVPASTSNNGQVVNGMSSSRRHTAFANSGIVVETRIEDLKDYHRYGALAGLRYQQHVEQLAAMNGGERQTAPAQRLTDFITGRVSSSLPSCSYLPSVASSPMHQWLPMYPYLKDAFRIFDHKMHGFITSESIVVGVESRSSSPVRIPRDESLQHIHLKGLFPCGEGSGYAGGITSSAIDGENAAIQVAKYC